MDFREIWYWSFFIKFVLKIQGSLESDMINRYFIWRPMYIYGTIYVNYSYSDKFQAEVAEQFKTYSCFMFNNVSPKSCRLWDNVEKYGKTRHVTYDNIIRPVRFACFIAKTAHARTHARARTHTHTHTHTHTLRLYVHCVFCYTTCSFSPSLINFLRITHLRIQQTWWTQS